MTAIPSNFGAGGAGLTPNGSSSSPDLASTLRDIADDLADLAGDGLTPVAVIATIDAVDPATTMALTNEIKAKVNELVARVNALSTGITIRTTKV